MISDSCCFHLFFSSHRVTLGVCLFFLAFVESRFSLVYKGFHHFLNVNHLYNDSEGDYLPTKCNIFFSVSIIPLGEMTLCL